MSRLDEEAQALLARAPTRPDHETSRLARLVALFASSGAARRAVRSAVRALWEALRSEATL